MKLKKAALMFVTAAALAANTIPAFAMGFVHADGGTKYDWGGGNYCTGNWVRRNDHWYYFGGYSATTPGITPQTPASCRQA